LRKILILLKNRADEMQDEFDGPNRPIHRIQLQSLLDKGALPAAFLVDESLALYDLVLADQKLCLRENLQGDLPEQERDAARERIAAQVIQAKWGQSGVPAQELQEYLMGRDEKVLSRIKETWSARDRDVLAFYKDQLSSFLKLTLGYSDKTRYTYSDDGKRVIPCDKGVKHNEAVFGTILEKINYTCQVHYQEGVHKEVFKDWLARLQKDAESSRDSAVTRFQEMFPTRAFDQLASYPISDLFKEVNQDTRKIRIFLEEHLRQIRVSGRVVSMDPQNIVSMNRTVSGVSATLGCPDAIHKQFEVDRETSQAIQAEMIYRLAGRMSGALLSYDPRNPKKMLVEANKNPTFCAVIDGAGAFRKYEPASVAVHLKVNVNDALANVGYHDEEGTVRRQGKQETSPRERTGFYFAEGYTRGSDISLPADGTAVMTINSNGTLEDLNQEEGRMRLPGQKVMMAKSSLAEKEIKTLGDVLQTKIAFSARKQAEDLFRSKKQELFRVVRDAIRTELFNYDDTQLEAFLDLFMAHEDRFITPASSTYDTEGSYFSMNGAIKKADQDPLAVLNGLKGELIALCSQANLK
jgi:hypothetical protein